MRIKIENYINCIMDCDAEDIFNLAKDAKTRELRLVQTSTAESGVAPVVFEFSVDSPSEREPTDQQVAQALYFTCLMMNNEVEPQYPEGWIDMNTLDIAAMVDDGFYDLYWTRKDKIEFIKLKTADLGVHEHDCWLGGEHEDQIEKWDDGTITDEELDRVIRTGYWSEHDS